MQLLGSRLICLRESKRHSDDVDVAVKSTQFHGVLFFIGGRCLQNCLVSFSEKCEPTSRIITKFWSSGARKRQRSNFPVVFFRNFKRTLHFKEMLQCRSNFKTTLPRRSNFKKTLQVYTSRRCNFKKMLQRSVNFHR